MALYFHKSGDIYVNTYVQNLDTGYKVRICIDDVLQEFADGRIKDHIHVNRYAEGYVTNEGPPLSRSSPIAYSY